MLKPENSQLGDLNAIRREQFQLLIPLTHKLLISPANNPNSDAWLNDLISDTLGKVQKISGNLSLLVKFLALSPVDDIE